MFGKKEVVLTATTCERLEVLRLAIEVFAAKRIRFKHFDFNTYRGKIQIGDDIKIITCVFKNERQLEFLLVEPEDVCGDRYIAFFNSSLQITMVKKMYTGQVWYCGRSMTDRWEKPMCL